MEFARPSAAGAISGHDQRSGPLLSIDALVAKRILHITL